MTQVQRVKIFLASPSDVPAERRSVKKVIDELNAHVALSKGVVLAIGSSERVIPGFGKDGQSIVNEQIGRMSGYELFIGIMAKRIGTPTMRAKSGTVEEYRRAVRSFKRNGNPQIWFYFRQPVTQFKSKQDEKQQRDVVKFREQIRKVALIRDYTSSTDFETQLRDHLTTWLLSRKRRRRASTTTTSNKQPQVIKAPSQKRRSQGSESVQGPGRWVMLHNNFYQATVPKIRSDRSIVLRISTTSREKIAELTSLYPKEAYRRRQLAYADNLNAAIVEVASVHTELHAKTTTFDIELLPMTPSKAHNAFSYNTNEMVTTQVRMLLLGEQPSNKFGLLSTTIPVTGLSSQGEIIDKAIFPALWTRLQTSPKLFLPKAWLLAAYYLKTSNLIEDILRLRLGPIENNVMAVQFRARRLGSNNQLEVIEVTGKCILDQYPN